MEKIILPEGWEIDREKSSDNEIVLKKVEAKKALTWEEIQGVNGEKGGTQYLLSASGGLVSFPISRSNISLMRSHLPSERIAEKIRALCQMYVIADYYNRVYADGWVADWNNNGQQKWYVRWDNAEHRGIIMVTLMWSSVIPYFATEELAILAYKNNREIFETALKP